MDVNHINNITYRISKNYFNHYRALRTPINDPNNIKTAIEIHREKQNINDFLLDENITRHTCASFIEDFKERFVCYTQNLAPTTLALHRIDGVICKNANVQIRIDDDIDYYYIYVEYMTEDQPNNFDSYKNIVQKILLEKFNTIEIKLKSEWTTIEKTTEDDESISLLAALADCYEHASIKEAICFEIRFPDVIRTIKFGKQYNENIKCLEYFIHETYAPRITCTESSFVGNLTKCSGVSFNSNKAPYTIKRLY